MTGRTDKGDKVEKLRLDQLLVDRELVDSRSRAQALVMAGLVYSGERKLDKAGVKVAADIALEVRGQDHPWVSRGGLKLEKGLAEFGCDPAGFVCIETTALETTAKRTRAIVRALSFRSLNDRNLIVETMQNARNTVSPANGQT